MKRFIGFFLLAGVMLSACLPQTTTVPSTAQTPAAIASPTNPPPTATVPPEPSPTTPPAPVAIAPANAAGLTQSAEAAIEAPMRLVWSTDSRVLGVIWTHADSATGTSTAHISLLDGASLQSLAEYSLPSPGMILDLSPDGRTAAVTNDMVSVELVDVTNGAVLQTLIPAHVVQAATFSPDGATVGLVSADTWQVTPFDVASGVMGTPLTGFETAAPVYSATFAPDGKTLIWHARGTVQLMDLPAGPLRPVISHEDFVMGIDLSRDGTRLATAAGGTISGQFVPLVYLWNAADSAQIAALEQPAVATALSFSPDGALLASATGTQVQLWDLATLHASASLSGPQDAITDLAFSPDGKTLAASASDGTVRLWKVME